MPGTACAWLSEALRAVLEWVLCVWEALLLPLPPPPSFIAPKGTCAAVELNFLRWLQMYLRSFLSLSLFVTPSPFCWKLLPSVLLNVEICGCNQTEEVGISDREIRWDKGPHHLSPLSPVPCVAYKSKYAT